jgi:tricorn protease interacting factor F2/3
MDEQVHAYKINAGQTGFYRVHYTAAADVEALAGIIRKQGMSPEDRWGVQNDLFAMVKAGPASMHDYLDLLESYAPETADLPLSSIDANLFAAGLTLEDNWWSGLSRKACAFITKTLKRIGYEPRDGEPQTLAMLREQMLWHAALYGDEAVLTFADDQFKAFADHGSIHPDLARSVMQAGILQGGEKAFRLLCLRLETTDSEHERMNILMALGSQKDPDLIRETCKYTLEHVPDRNRFIPLVALCLNPHAIPLMWDWFLENVQTLETFHPLLYERVIAGVIPLPGMNNPEAVIDFFTAYMGTHPQTVDVVKLSLEKLEINLAMRKRAGKAPEKL